MNNSSVIFVGGFTLVFGFFANQSFKADAMAVRVSDIRAAQFQADIIAMSGCYLASYYLATPTTYDGFVVNNRTCNYGKLDYRITLDPMDASKAYVVSTGRIVKVGSGGADVAVTKRAELVKGLTGRGNRSSWAQWSIQKVYTDPYTISDVVD